MTKIVYIGAPNIITAESKPVYDKSVLPGYVSKGAWTCVEWVYWHYLLIEKYGVSKAKHIFLIAWKRQRPYARQALWCRFDSSYAKHFDKYGLTEHSVISTAWKATHTIVNNTFETIENTSKGLKGLVSNVSSIAGGRLFLYASLGIGGYLGYQHFLKPYLSK